MQKKWQHLKLPKTKVVKSKVIPLNTDLRCVFKKSVKQPIAFNLYGDILIDNKENL